MKKVVALINNPDFVKYEKETLGGMEDVEFVICPADSDEEMKAAVRDADAIIFTAAKLHGGIIDSMERCGIIVRCGIGYDTVDLVRTRERGIFVCNTPNYGVTDVAEHAMSLMLAAAKRLVMMNDRIRAGRWGGGMGPSVRLAGKTVGFAGFGNIGRCVCTRTNACAMTPVVYDPFVRDEVLGEYGARRVTFDELLAESDFISLHMPLNKNTAHMFNAGAFEKMKESAILINTARGGLVDEAALIDALLSGKIAGAGLDVFEDESGGMDKRMLEASNVVLTPHVAWNTPEAAFALHKEVADNIIRFFGGERPQSIVNGL